MSEPRAIDAFEAVPEDKHWAVRELVEAFAGTLGDAENFVTLTARMPGRSFEVTLRRCGGKTPEERIGELEAERDALFALLCKSDELADSPRGAGGFGSTGRGTEGGNGR